ncbi:DUF5710 domain-containing protein [Gynurincola endophyticus]|uniref:DUF5710 domain-containing protein n=1 Tax=Gynurincola endophyticus TaxID=2479004 RepID=UPI000F8F67C5|nr:DUF5710 domain-containing protein [Gynurincola endophyticus]
MPLKLNVPYADKELAKSKGAFWDAEEKTWYVPDHRNINDFLTWFDTDKIDTILKTPFYMASNKRSCWKCKKKITVLALYSDNFYYLDEEGSDNEESVFEKAELKSFFSHVFYIDENFASFVRQQFPDFKLGFSKTVNGEYWANHCEFCHALQGDHFNHESPGGAFFPVTDEECENITLIQIPFKFDVGITGSYSDFSNQDRAFERAKKKLWHYGFKL